MKCALRRWRLTDAKELAAALNNRKILNNLRDGLPFPYTGQDASEYIAAMLSANENDAFAYAITISDRAIGSIAVSSLKPPTFSAFMLGLSHATEAPGEHWRKPDSAMRVP